MGAPALGHDERRPGQRDGLRALDRVARKPVPGRRPRLGAGQRDRDPHRYELEPRARVGVAVAVLVRAVERAPKLRRIGRGIAVDGKLERLPLVAEVVCGPHLGLVAARLGLAAAWLGIAAVRLGLAAAWLGIAAARLGGPHPAQLLAPPLRQAL